MFEVIEQPKKITVEEFQKNFDDLFSRVENGESFMITSNHGSVMITPYNQVWDGFLNYSEDDIIRIHTTHEDAS